MTAYRELVNRVLAVKQAGLEMGLAKPRSGFPIPAHSRRKWPRGAKAAAPCRPPAARGAAAAPSAPQAAQAWSAPQSFVSAL